MSVVFIEAGAFTSKLLSTNIFFVFLEIVNFFKEKKFCMNNLERLNLTELSGSEMKNIDGGFICGGLCFVGILAGISFVVGLGVGVGIYSWSRKEH